MRSRWRWTAGWALFAGVGNPVNKVIGIGFDAPPDEAAFAEVERAFAVHGSESPRRGVHPGARRDATRGCHGVAITSKGSRTSSAGRSARPTPSAGQTTETRALHAIAVAPVGDPDVDAWIAAVTTGFASPDDSGAGGDQPLPPTGELAAIMDDVFRAGGVTRYLARIDGDVAGGASMKVEAGIALLAGAATLPAFRRRGVQRALLQARLADAARAGCELAVVVTQPGSTSQANVQRQEFELLYARAVLVKS